MIIKKKKKWIKQQKNTKLDWGMKLNVINVSVNGFQFKENRNTHKKREKLLNFLIAIIKRVEINVTKKI